MRRAPIALLFLAALFIAVIAFAETPITYVVTQEKAPAYEIGKGSGLATLFLNSSTGASDLAMSTLNLKPGAAVPPHRHLESSEAIYLLEGVIEMTIAGKMYRASAGDAVYIPKGVEHSATVPKGGQSVKALQVYIGPGPEQRFTKGRLVNAK